MSLAERMADWQERDRERVAELIAQHSALADAAAALVAAVAGAVTASGPALQVALVGLMQHGLSKLEATNGL